MAGNYDALEEYAQGQGGGLPYSPQQGSMLPVSPPARQGGLPLGQAPSTIAAPTTQPAPMPSMPAAPFQQAPLLSLGGQPAPLEQMIQQRLQAVQNYPNLSFWQKFAGGGAARGAAMNELPLLQKQAEIRSQGRDIQAKTLADLQAHLKDFGALSDVEQANQRPLYQKLIGMRAQLGNIDLTPEDIADATKSRDTAQQYASLLNDSLIDPAEAGAAIGQTKPGTSERLAAIGMVTKQAEQKAVSLVQSMLPQVIAQMGGSVDKPVKVADVMAQPQVKQYLDQSPTLKRVFNSYLNEKYNHESLANIGVDVSGLKRQEQQVKGIESTGEVKDALATMMGPDGKPLTPVTAGALPAGTTITLKGGKPMVLARGGADAFDIAKNQVFNDKLDVSKNQGYNAVIAKAEGERKIPLVQVPGMADVHVVNKASEMPVDRLTQTIDDLREGGGETKFAVMNNKSYEAFAAAKEADGILGQYLDISKALTTTPGANFGQALMMYAKTKGGVENPGVQFDALKGTILRMARAMQGSSQSLSNLDANSVGGMLPTPMDTAQSAIQRLEIAAKIVQNMKDVQLGKMPPAQLLEKIDAAKRDIVKMTGVVITDGKVKAVIPKGQSIPKGWKPVE